MQRSQYTYYVIILGGVRAMIILITRGGGHNWAKVDYVICALSLIKGGRNFLPQLIIVILQERLRLQFDET